MFYPAPRRVIANGNAGQKDNNTNRDYGRHGVAEPIAQSDCAANRLEGEKRNGAQRRIRYLRQRPAPSTFGGKAQRVVFQCLIRNPAIVFAANAEYPLLGVHKGKFILIGSLRCFGQTSWPWVKLTS